MSQTVKMIKPYRERKRTMDFDVTYKVLLVGETGVGKTSLITSMKGADFRKSLLPTVGVDFVNQDFDIDGVRVRLQIWDTAGQERFRTITKFQYRGTKGVLLVFDRTNQSSFEKMQYWLRSLEEEDLDNETLIVVGNKSDLQDCGPTVSSTVAENFAKSHSVRYMETSAKTGQNVHEVFRQLAKDLVEHNDSRLLNAFNYTVRDLTRLNREDEANENSAKPLYLRSDSFKLKAEKSKHPNCCKT